MSHHVVTDIDQGARATLATLLNAQLADTIDLRLAVKQAHWNLRGPAFIALHELFDQVAVRLDEHVDVMAERIVQLGGIAAGTTQGVARATRLAPYPAAAVAQAEHLVEVRERLAALARSTRAAIDRASEAGDADTADILTGVSRAVDKDLWLVGAHLTS